MTTKMMMVSVAVMPAAPAMMPSEMVLRTPRMLSMSDPGIVSRHGMLGIALPWFSEIDDLAPWARSPPFLRDFRSSSSPTKLRTMV